MIQAKGRSETGFDGRVNSKDFGKRATVPSQFFWEYPPDFRKAGYSAGVLVLAQCLGIFIETVYRKHMTPAIGNSRY